MWYFAQMMMYLDTSQKSPIRYDMIQALKNVSRFDTDPEKVYLDTRYVSNIAILCTTGWKNFSGQGCVIGVYLHNSLHC